jgi:hypothetical protein
MIVILVVGLVFGLGLRSLPSATAPTGVAQAAAVPQASLTGGNDDPLEPAPPVPIVVSCGQGQQAVVRQAAWNGQVVSHVECVPRAAFQGAREPAASSRAAIREVVYDSEAAPAPRVVRTAQVSAPREQSRAPVEPRRSWQKTALVIGGSTAAGAGAGGAIGGKKGALIGAAIGGGASTLFEAFKRR